jgi:hypothetical protein
MSNEEIEQLGGEMFVSLPDFTWSLEGLFDDDLFGMIHLISDNIIVNFRRSKAKPSAIKVHIHENNWMILLLAGYEGDGLCTTLIKSALEEKWEDHRYHVEMVELCAKDKHSYGINCIRVSIGYHTEQ